MPEWGLIDKWTWLLADAAELLSMVQALDDAWPFRRPVEDGETLDYYDIILDPVDLSLIESRLGSKYVGLLVCLQPGWPHNVLSGYDHFSAKLT